MLLLALIALGVPLAVSLRDRVDAEVRGQARSQADVVAASASELLDPRQRPALRHLVRISADSVRGRVIVVDRRGRLLADSAGAPAGRSYADRPEVRAALSGHGEQITRNSKTLGAEILATSAPVLEPRRDRGGGAGHPERRRRPQRGEDGDPRPRRAGRGSCCCSASRPGPWSPSRSRGRSAASTAPPAGSPTGDLDATVAVEGSTEQRSLARAFNEMTQRVKRLLRVQQDFVADASHQLRTPLTGLRLRLEALAEEAGDGDPGAAELDAALAEIDRLSLIVDELLILSRAGEHELPGERIDLREAARRAAERWRPRGRGALDRASRSGESEPARHAWCAPHDLDRSIDALLENALRYSPAGSTVRIEAGPGRIEDPRPRPRPRARRGGRRLRALPPRQRRPPGTRGDRPRPADRPRADPPVGWRGDPAPPARAAAPGATIDSRLRRGTRGESRVKRL